MLTLVYDPRCGPCTRFRNAVDLLDVRETVAYMGLDDADRRGKLATVDPTRRYRSFHLISPEGYVWSGAEALPKLAAILPGGALISAGLTLCPPATSAAGFVYAAFSRLHDSSCNSRPA